MANYDFSSLSPSDFEMLMRDLLRAKHGWDLEMFGSGPDGGVDLRSISGQHATIVQCKHYAGSRFSDLRRAARSEKEKIEREHPYRYIFATTQELSRSQKESLCSILNPWLSSTEDLLTRLEINRMIEDYPVVESQHFKLWMASSGILQRIVRSGLWERSEALMESVEERARLYVSNPSYTTASEMLSSKHVVVISGPPGVGKSMLGEMLALAHWHEGWQVVTLNSGIEEGWDSWISGQRQLFFFDDFLGQTDINERRGRNESQSTANFVSRVAKNKDKRFALTTRSHVLRQAQNQDEPLMRMMDDTNEYVLKIEDYGLINRARILYNHLYFSQQARSVVKDFARNRDSYRAIIRHPNFNPRTIEQILRRSHDSGKSIAQSTVRAFNRPIDLWGPSFENFLSDVAREVLLLLVCHPTSGTPEALIRRNVLKVADPIRYRHAMKSLEGSWINLSGQGGLVGTQVKFANPSCRDFVLSFVDEHPNYLDFYLSRCSTLGELCTLLRYATSRIGVGWPWKYPGLNSEIRTRREVVALAVKQFWDQGVVEALADRLLDECFRDLIEFDEIFELGLSDWLPISLIRATPGAIPHSTNVSSVAKIVRYLIRYCSTLHVEEIRHNYDISGAFRVWAQELISTATSDEDWCEIATVVAPIEGTVLDDMGPQSINNCMRASAIDIYKDELRQLVDQLENKDDIEARISKVMSVGTVLKIAGYLQDSVDDVRRELIEVESYEPDGLEQLDDEIDEEAVPSLDPSRVYQERHSYHNVSDEVDNLFDHLM